MVLVMNYFLDKLFWIILIFEIPFRKTDSDYNYQRDFLGKSENDESLNSMLKSVFSIAMGDVNRIYNIKSTTFSETIYQKLKYCIVNKFWGIFAFTSSEGGSLNDTINFADPSLMVYLIVKEKDKEKIAVVTKVTVKHLEVLFIFQNVNSRLFNFQDRKLVYAKEMGFKSL